jgi:regulator of protease activity HflC (stomatin/prohibitin superfamily)
MTVLICVFLAFFFWFLLGFIQVRENENGVVVLLGLPRRVVSSGLRHIWWPFEKVVRFTTAIIEIKLPEAAIITKAGEYEGLAYGAATIRVASSLYFRWPEENELLQTIRVIANPENQQTVKDLFEEAILDAVRTVGGNKTWREITANRKGIAKESADILAKEPSEPLKLAGLKDLAVVITRVSLPDELNAAIIKPEVADLEREVVKKQADGEAYARGKIFDAIGDDLDKEKLFTLREMAKNSGGSMFVIPAEIMSVFQKAESAGVSIVSVLREFGFDDNQIESILKNIHRKGGK